MVVTIIVLLILASVTISTVFSDDGIIKKAQEAANRTQDAIKQEQEELNQLYNELASAMNSVPEEPVEPSIEFALNNVNVNIKVKSNGIIGVSLFDGEFAVEIKNQDGEVVSTGKNNSEGKVIFDNSIIFKKPGTYTYKVQQKDVQNAEYFYVLDKTEYSINIEVEEIEGKLTAKINQENIELVNNKEKIFTKDDIEFYIPVKQDFNVDNNAPEDVDDKFTYDVYELVDGTSPELIYQFEMEGYENKMIYINDYLKSEYLHTGLMVELIIKQHIDDSKGEEYTLDLDPHFIKIYVREKNEQYEVAIIIEDVHGKAEGDAVFTNSYQGKAPTPPQKPQQ